MDFEAALKYLDSFVSYEQKPAMDLRDFDLQRVRDFLRAYKVDYSKLDFVHVAGSKGKGTVCNLAAQYLWKAGYRVGLFTSPHVLTIRERFWANGKPISKGEFAALVGDFKGFTDKCCDKLPDLTWFEVLTVLALNWFAALDLDFVVMEVGLGGRLDATNVITPKLSVITMIEKEHADILGPTVEKILMEKLGIVKNGVPVLVGYQNPEVDALIRKKLKRRRSVYFISDDGIVMSGDARTMNGEIACATLKILLSQVDEDLFAEVLADLKMPGRFDVRKFAGRTLVFDVAHTVNSIKNLVAMLGKNFPGKKYIFVVALMKGKEIKPILDIVSAAACRLYFADAHVERGVSAAELVKIAGGKVLENFNDVLGSAKEDDVVVITGSTFLVSKMMKELGMFFRGSLGL